MWEGILVLSLLVLVPLVVIALMRWVPRAWEALLRQFLGEPDSLIPCGPMTRGGRLRRAIELQAVVSRLALITRLNLPLSPALEAAAQGETKRTRRALLRISEVLQRGEPISEALAVAFPKCPVQLTTTLHAAEQCGQLGPALSDQERMIAGTINARLDSNPYFRNAAIYAGLMTLIILMMTYWATVFLLPRLRTIFQDFESLMPWPTAAISSGSIALLSFSAGWVIPISVLLCCALLFFYLISQMVNKNLMMRLVTAIRRFLPPTRAIDSGLGTAKVARAILLGIRSGGLTSLAPSFPNLVSPSNHLRSNLTAFARSISEGAVPHTAARDAGLGDVLVGALQMVERGEDADLVLGRAAEYYEAIAYRWWRALAALCGPLVTLVMAAIVAFVSLALFLPLIALINSVAETI